MDTTTALVLLCVFVVGLWIFRKHENLTPGPTPWPLLENLPEMARLMHTKPFHMFEIFRKGSKI